MDQETTTDEPIQPEDSGAVDALPEEGEADSPAADTPQEPTQTSEPEGGEDEDPPLPDEEYRDKLAKFAKGQGIENLDELSKREYALLKSAYDTKVAFERSRQEASSLQKSLGDTPAVPDTDNPLLADLVAKVQTLEVAQTVNQFWVQNPEAKEYEEKMTEIVNTRPEVGRLVNAGYLTLNDLYNMARGGDHDREADIMAKGGREALQKVAKKQQAKANPGNALATSFSVPESDPVLEVLRAD